MEKGHLFYPYPQNTEIADRDLLPSFHSISVYPKKDLPFFIIFTAALFTITALLAVLTHQVFMKKKCFLFQDSNLGLFDVKLFLVPGGREGLDNEDHDDDGAALFVVFG